MSESEIPEMMFKAITSIEDKRFFQHNGFDFGSVARVITAGAAGAKQGGSTFTMQLVKNAFFDDDVERERSLGKRTIRRKLRELVMLPMVENSYTKKQILTYYLNLIDFTPGAQGIKMAALDLFGIDNLHNLSLDQIALLSALPKGTSKYNPRMNPKDSKLRRDTILRVMEEQGLITQEDLNAYQ